MASARGVGYGESSEKSARGTLCLVPIDALALWCGPSSRTDSTIARMVTWRLRKSGWSTAAGRALGLIGLLGINSPIAADDRSGAFARGPVDYMAQVKPILTQHCVECHGAQKPRGGLRLDTAAGALKGAKSGAVIIPGHADESPLVDALRGEGDTERMPLKRPALSESDIRKIHDWIDQGAKGAAGEAPGVPQGAIPLVVCRARATSRAPDFKNGLVAKSDRQVHSGSPRPRRAVPVA